MTSSVLGVARFDIRVRDGKDWTRMAEGAGPGEFRKTQYGVEVQSRTPGRVTLIPWSNILVIEPTT